MSEPQAFGPDDWSLLNTVRDFDVGFDTSERNIIKASEIARTSANSIFIQSLIDQLCKLLEKDPLQQRKIYEAICTKLNEMKIIDNTYQVQELASLRGHYQQALVSFMPTSDTRMFKVNPMTLEWSRYQTEYEEICFLASGGFGKVYKAKHLLDEVIYAVKKISLRCKDVTAFLTKLGEVKTLAKLNHCNIVQYKAAWLEPLICAAPALPPSDFTSLSQSNGSDEIIFQHSTSSTGSSGQAACSSKKTETNLALCQYVRTNKTVKKKAITQVGAVLYVSMQLCDETLRDWLQRRNSYSSKTLDLDLAIGIMKEAAKGVEYIHSCNIVHHDIKPSNIFLGNDLKVIQVGDFGLSCCLQGHNHSDCPLEGGQFGTPLYAAPEQLKGRCEAKSDMFSLGLILIELLVPFSTEMERVEVLTKVRSGYLPPTIPFGLLPIVKDLTSLRYQDRPSATELINQLDRLTSRQGDAKISLSFTKTRLVSLSEESDDSIILQEHDEHDESDLSVLQMKDQMIKDKDEEIIQLKRILAQRDIEIAQLKKFINRITS